MTMTQHVTAVVVSWNTATLLEDCLRGIHADIPAGCAVQTVVVDNASGDDSVEVARRWDGVDVIVNDVNVGFCRANNQAIRATSGRWVLMVNADAVLEPGCLEQLLLRGEADPRTAVVAPRLVFGDGRWQRWTAGCEPNLWTMAMFLTGADRLSGWLPALRGHYLGADTRHAFRPDWVSSACLLVRREALEQVGLLDERIFVYMDDVDLCRRLRNQGWDIWYEPAAQAVHLMGQSTLRQTGRTSPEALRAFNRYFLSQQGAHRTRLLRAMQVVGFATRAGVHAVLALAQRESAHLASSAAHLTHLSLSLETPERP